MSNRSQLLCTFALRNSLDVTLEIIAECNEIIYDKIYVFQNENDINQLICTYNIEYDEDFLISEDTISLHRKKQTNTLYTINALNCVIRELNDGVLDKKFPIPWENYQNKLLLTNDLGLNAIPTRIHSIIKVSELVQNN